MEPTGPLISLADYERAAEAVLEAGPFGYGVGGAGEEITLRDNVAAWRRVAILPRVLVGVGERDPEVTLLGKPRPHPLIIAPMGYQRLAHREAEIGMARAAAATGSIFCLSTFGTTTPAELARAEPDVSRWFQLYVLKDRGVSRDLVAQAAANGYEALVVTVDRPISGRRERDIRSEVRSTGADLVPSANLARAGGDMAPMDFVSLIDPNLAWDDIEQLATDSELPVLVKGILTPSDAQRAVDHGARAIVVSNHGGRQLDTVLSGADALPPIIDAVGDQVEVIVDGGIRRGTDILKALSLGASAVQVGRPVLWGLAVDGASGAEAVLRILLDDFDTTLALAGAPSAAQLDRSFVTPAPWVGPPR
jgi:4-hydroxymandelate oxidase